MTLLTRVAPGGYLVYYEIHLAEFYPSCTQILVGGSQTGTPNQTVSFPGAYHNNDLHIYDLNVYDDPVSTLSPTRPCPTPHSIQWDPIRRWSELTGDNGDEGLWHD